MDIHKNKNFWHEIRLDEYDLKLSSIKFIEDLRKDYTKYIQWWTNYYRQKENILEDTDRDVFLSKRPDINKYRMFPRINKRSEKRVSFKPEFISNRSPLTIIDGSWGVGKTHFINETFSLIKSGQIDVDKEFKVKVSIHDKFDCEINCAKIHRFISIDAWKYSATNDILNDFLAELSVELSSFYKWNSTHKKIKKLLLSLFNNVLLQWINRFFKVDFKSLTQKERNISNLNKYISKTTLLVIDNIERLGKNAWEIIRIIQRLSELKNLIFVLPMNLIKFNELCQIFSDSKTNINENNSGEWNIYKYITMPCYKIKQKYDRFFLDLGFDKENSNVLDRIFTLGTKYDGQNYSIRELNNLLNYKNINELKLFNILKLLAFVKNSEILYIDEKCNNYINSVIEKEIIKFETLISLIITDFKEIWKNYKKLELNNPFNDYYLGPEVKYRCLNNNLLECTYHQIKNKIDSLTNNDMELINVLKNYIDVLENRINEINQSEVLKIVNEAESYTIDEYYKEPYCYQEDNVVKENTRKEEINFRWHHYVILNIFKILK